MAAVGAMLGLALVAAGSAQAAVTLGQISPPGSPLGCNSGSFIVQTGAAAGNDYRVPPGGGVITEWSAQSWSKGSPDQILQLALLGSAVSKNEVTFEGLSTFEHVISKEGFDIQSFKTRVPVDGGERLGLYAQAGGSFTYTCVYGFNGEGPADRIIWGDIAEPIIGGPPVLASKGQVLEERIPLEAKLEADADHDGFGDETQDLCPTNAATQGPCPPPPAPDTSITKHPKAKTTSKTASFDFSATIPGATFECQLDKGSFKACTSPFAAKVGKGKHTFAVRATANGQTDSSPATFKWKVKKKKRHRSGHHT